MHTVGMENCIVIINISSNPSSTTLCVFYVGGILMLCPYLQARILVEYLYHMDVVRI